MLRIGGGILVIADSSKPVAHVHIVWGLVLAAAFGFGFWGLQRLLVRWHKSRLSKLASRMGWQVEMLPDDDDTRGAISVTAEINGYTFEVSSHSNVVSVKRTGRLRRPNGRAEFFLGTSVPPMDIIPPGAENLPTFATNHPVVDRYFRSRFASPKTAAAIRGARDSLDHLGASLRATRRLVRTTMSRPGKHGFEFRMGVADLFAPRRVRFPRISSLERSLPELVDIAATIDEASGAVLGE